MIWPVDGKKLIIDFVPESEIHQAMEKNQSPFNASSDKDKDKLATLKTQIKPNDPLPANLNVTNKVVNTQNEEEPVKTLDSLFKKTETKPHLYYLPLSEEEVQEKRLKLNKSVDKC
jgi:apoptotic chromatin condensation inducer in the nucleus